MILRGLSFLAGVIVAAGALRATDPVLIREVISREVGIHVGGVQTPENREVISREIGVFVGAEPTPPFREVVSREVSLVNVGPEAPPPMTEVVVSSTPRGDRVELDWRSYDQWRVGDVSHFDVYYANRGFTNVTEGTLIRRVPGEATGTVLSGLPEWQDHYFAVVAVDGLGNQIATVEYFGAYILTKEVISREVGVFVGSEPTPPWREIVSRELSLVVSTPEAPPAIMDLRTRHSPKGDTVELDWSSYNQWAVGDVVRYDIYFSDRAIIDVSGMTPYARISGEVFSATFGGLPALQDHFFAVVPVDGQGNFISEVNYAGAYVLMSEVVSREVGLFVGGDPEPPLRELVSREVSVVVADDTVPSPVTGLESGFTAVTSLLRPRALRLQWRQYNEVGQRDVVSYRIYLDRDLFTNVIGIEFQQVSAERSEMEVNGLDSKTIYYAAVVAVDSTGAFDPVVRPQSAITTPRLEMSIPDLVTEEGSLFSYQLEVTERDLTAYDLSFALVSGPSGMTVTRDGRMNWSLGEAEGPAEYPVTVSVTDNGLPPVTALSQFVIRVQEANQLPALAGATNGTLPEMVGFNRDLGANDPDLPMQTLVVKLEEGPVGLVVIDGVLAWTPTEAQGPSTNGVTVTVSDGVATVTNRFDLVVLEVNQPPLLTAVPDQAVNEGELLTVSLVGSDADIPVPPLSYSLVSGPAGMLVRPEGTLTWTPTSVQGPSMNAVTVSVSDGELSAQRSFTVTVTDLPEAPVVVLPPPGADGLLTLEVIATAGREVIVETATDLNTWAEAQRVTGQGSGVPVRVRITPENGVEARFWRARVR